MAEGFSRVDVADMNLEKRDIHTQQSISDCDACMCESPRVDDDGVHFPTRFMNAIQYHAFMIGLQVCKCDGFVGALLFGCLDYLRKRSRAICSRLTGTQEVQVGSVDKED